MELEKKRCEWCSMNNLGKNFICKCGQNKRYEKMEHELCKKCFGCKACNDCQCILEEKET